MSPDLDAPPPTPDDAFWEAVGRYYAGESDPAEAARVEAWLSTNPDARFVRRLDGVAKAMAPSVSVDIESALRKVNRKIDVPSKSRDLQFRRRSTVDRRLYAIPALAAAAVLIVVGRTVLKKQKTPAILTPTPTERTIATAIGQRDSVILADGTRILIGGGSTITIPGDYGTSSREVALDGRAYFDVKHDSTKPFSIRAGDATIRDIGTTFDVSSDSADGVYVAVTSGVVELTSAQQPVRLEAGQASSARRGAPPSRPRAVNATDTSWVVGRMEFRDAPMSRVASELHRFRGITVVFANPGIDTLPFRGYFEVATPQEVTNMLGTTLGVSAHPQGDTVILSGNPRRR